MKIILEQVLIAKRAKEIVNKYNTPTHVGNGKLSFEGTTIGVPSDVTDASNRSQVRKVIKPEGTPLQETEGAPLIPMGEVMKTQTQKNPSPKL